MFSHLKMAKASIKKLKKRRRENSIVEIESKIEKTLFPSLVLKYLVPLVKLVSIARIFPKSLAIIITKMGII